MKDKGKKYFFRVALNIFEFYIFVTERFRKWSFCGDPKHVKAKVL